MSQWEWHDGADTWVMVVNPKAMTNPIAPVSVRTLGRISGDPLALMESRHPVEWKFSGRMTDEIEYGNLVDWCKRRHTVLIIDHLSRLFTIRVTGLNVNELRPNPRHPFRVDYEVTALMIAGP